MPSALASTPAVDQCVEIVRIRIAEVEGGGVPPMLGEDRCKAAVDLGEGLIPGRFLEIRAVSDQRRPDAIRVLVQGLEPVALGADEAVAEDVVGVALDPVTTPSATVSSRPQVASQSGQVRKAVRESGVGATDTRKHTLLIEHLSRR